jgi:2-amino-4-hydroxy-6-hydroxymethyldihydropteridine diphosphokinase
MTEAFLALGGNIGDSRTIIEQAIGLLCDEAEVRLTARSSDYRTAPWGLTNQPSFINACIAVRTTLTPLALLARAHDVERRLGRSREQEQRWGPRTIDIDILTYDDLTIDEANLILPHPRLFERAFALVPLAEIAPQQTINGIRIRDAIVKIDSSNIEKLPPR